MQVIIAGITDDSHQQRGRRGEMGHWSKGEHFSFFMPYKLLIKHTGGPE